jgi:hypothetical protein
MRKEFEVTFIITDGKAVYPPRKKNIIAHSEEDLYDELRKYLSSNMGGYGIRRGFTFEITEAEYLHHTY